jgi:hypothetical protein
MHHCGICNSLNRSWAGVTNHSNDIPAMVSEMRELEVLEVLGLQGWVCILQHQQPGVCAYDEMRTELQAQVHCT